LENKAEKERSIIIDAFQMLFSNFPALILTLVITWSIAPNEFKYLIQIKPINTSRANVWNHKKQL
jgi:hypothetical protein